MIVILLICFIHSLDCKAAIQQHSFYGGARDSVLIDVNDIKAANIKMIEGLYCEQLLNEAYNIIENQDAEIEFIDSIRYYFQNEFDEVRIENNKNIDKIYKLKFQRNALGITTISLFLLLVL